MEYKKKVKVFFHCYSKEKLRFIQRLKSFHFIGKENKIDEMDRKGRSFALQMTKENLSDFDIATRKLIMTETREFYFYFAAIVQYSKTQEKKHRRINKKTIIFNRNLCFFPALLSLATFMLSINFHFLLFGHSLDCHTSLKSPLRGRFCTLSINLKQ